MHSMALLFSPFSLSIRYFSCTFAKYRSSISTHRSDKKMFVNLLRIIGLIFLGSLSVVSSINAQDTPANDSTSSDSLRMSETEDERDRPLGDTTSVFYYYMEGQSKLTHIDTSLQNFEYPNVSWRRTDADNWLDLGHLGTARNALFWTAEPKAGFRLGLDAFDAYRLHLDDIPYFSVGGKRPYTDLYYSQINTQNMLIRARFAHQATPFLYYSLQFGLLNYNGYFSGQRSRHQDIAVNLRYQKGKYSAFFTFINNANNQSENGGLVDNALDSVSNLFLGTQPVQLNVQTAGSPKHENRHQTISYKHFWQNVKVDSATNTSSASAEIGHHLLFENNRYKYFDKSPEADSSFYGFFQTNNRGIRHYIGHIAIENELSYRQALGGTLKNAPIIFRAFVAHRFNRVAQEPQLFYVQNFSAGAEIYDALPTSSPLSYQADLRLTNSRLGLDFWLRGKLNFKIKNFVAIGGNALFQRYEPEQIARQLYVSQTLVWDNNSGLKQTQDFSLNGYLAWPKWWGRFEIGNHTITNPIYFDSTAVVQQLAGTANILQLRLKQDLHIWKLHLENDLAWQRVLAGNSVFRLPELLFRHKLYYEGKVFKTVRLRAGIALRYMTAFNANAYFPLLGRFYVQNQEELSFYPVADVFLSVKIWQMRFFVNAENLTYYLFNSKNYYTAPSYANPNWFVRMGLSWQLFD